MKREAQSVPVRIYQAPRQIVLAAPMPGLEAGDISITIDDQFVTISGKERGPGQHDRDLIVDEWNIGPYFREVNLRQSVNGTLTNATYGNGVLVLSMPKANGGEAISFHLSPIESARGKRVGHKGTDINPASEEVSKK